MKNQEHTDERIAEVEHALQKFMDRIKKGNAYVVTATNEPNLIKEEIHWDEFAQLKEITEKRIFC